MEPLIWTIFVIARDHIPIRNILAEAVDRLSDTISIHYSASLLMLMVGCGLLTGLRSLATESSQELLILLIADWLHHWVTVGVQRCVGEIFGVDVRLARRVKA